MSVNTNTHGPYGLHGPNMTTRTKSAPKFLLRNDCVIVCMLLDGDVYMEVCGFDRFNPLLIGYENMSSIYCQSLRKETTVKRSVDGQSVTLDVVLEYKLRVPFDIRINEGDDFTLGRFIPAGITDKRHSKERFTYELHKLVLDYMPEQIIRGLFFVCDQYKQDFMDYQSMYNRVVSDNGEHFKKFRKDRDMLTNEIAALKEEVSLLKKQVEEYRDTKQDQVCDGKALVSSAIEVDYNTLQNYSKVYTYRASDSTEFHVETRDEFCNCLLLKMHPSLVIFLAMKNEVVFVGVRVKYSYHELSVCSMLLSLLVEFLREGLQTREPSGLLIALRKLKLYIHAKQTKNTIESATQPRSPSLGNLCKLRDLNSIASVSVVREPLHCGNGQSPKSAQLNKPAIISLEFSSYIFKHADQLKRLCLPHIGDFQRPSSTTFTLKELDL
jgi:hypothetical protein